MKQIWYPKVVVLLTKCRTIEDKTQGHKKFIKYVKGLISIQVSYPTSKLLNGFQFHTLPLFFHLLSSFFLLSFSATIRLGRSSLQTTSKGPIPQYFHSCISTLPSLFWDCLLMVNSRGCLWLVVWLWISIGYVVEGLLFFLGVGRCVVKWLDLTLILAALLPLFFAMWKWESVIFLVWFCPN